MHRLQQVLRAQYLHHPPLVEDAFGAQARALLRQLDVACANADDLAAAAVAHFDKHPDAEIITSQPGLGSLTGALLAGCARHLKPGGKLVAGFQLGRGYELDQYDAEFRTADPQGRVRWVRAIGRAFYDAAGTPIRFDGITVDVTGRIVKTGCSAVAATPGLAAVRNGSSSTDR